MKNNRTRCNRTTRRIKQKGGFIYTKGTKNTRKSASNKISNKKSYSSTTSSTRKKSTFYL